MFGNPSPLSFDSATLSNRLNARVTRSELIATVFALAVLGGSTWYHQLFNHIPYDYWNYFNTTAGNFTGYFYSYTFLPFISLLGQLPFFWGYFLLGVLNLLGVFLAARIFGGNSVFVLLSFQSLYTLYFGNLIGVIVGSLALFWWSLAQKKWVIAGLLLTIALTKYQLGILSGVFLLLLADITWKDRMRVLGTTTAILLLSLIIYPGWPIASLQTILNNPPNDTGSITLWRWLGALALLLWIPPLFLPLSPKRRLIILSAATALAVPYFQQTDLLFLFSLPIGWPILLGNLGYLFLRYRWDVLPIIALAPLMIYISELFQFFRARHLSRAA